MGNRKKKERDIKWLHLQRSLFFVCVRYMHSSAFIRPIMLKICLNCRRNIIPFLVLASNHKNENEPERLILIHMNKSIGNRHYHQHHSYFFYMKCVWVSVCVIAFVSFNECKYVNLDLNNFSFSHIILETEVNCVKIDLPSSYTEQK